MEKYLSGISGEYINARYRISLDTDLSDVMDKFEDLSTWCVIGLEGGANEVHPHIHLVCPGHPGTKHKHSEWRKTLDNKMKSLLVKSGQNKYMKLCRSLNASLKYAIKCGNFRVHNPGQLRSQGIDIKVLYTQSYLKNSGDTRIAKDLEKLENEYYKNKITYKEFGVRFVKLRLKYGFTISPLVIKNYLIKHYLKKNPQHISSYIMEECKVYGYNTFEDELDIARARDKEQIKLDKELNIRFW